MLRWIDSFLGHGRLSTIVAVSALIGGISLAGILVVYVIDQVSGDDSTAAQGPTGGTGTSLPGTTAPGATPPATGGTGGPPASTPPPTSTPPTQTQTTPPPSNTSPFGGGQGLPGGVGGGGGP